MPRKTRAEWLAAIDESLHEDAAMREPMAALLSGQNFDDSPFRLPVDPPPGPAAAAWVSARVIAPAVNVVIVDTGQLAAGDYRVEATIGIADTVAVGKGVALEKRDAANGATQHSAVVPAAAALTIVWERVAVALNERLRVVNLNVAGTALSVYAASIRAALL